MFYGSLVLVGSTVALFFALQGFWPVLPFAGLELGALLYCVRLVNRRAADRDWIEIDSDTVTVRRQRLAGSDTRRFNRAWTTVRDSAGGNHRGLAIGASNQWCVVGEFLTDDERKGLLRRLRQILSATSADNG